MKVSKLKLLMIVICCFMVPLSATKSSQRQEKNDESIVKNNQIECSAGSIISFAGETPPAGWLLCHGQTCSSEEYPELYKVIKTKYVPAHEELNILRHNADEDKGYKLFYVPDLRGRVIVGVDEFSGLAMSNNIFKVGGCDQSPTNMQPCLFLNYIINTGKMYNRENEVIAQLQRQISDLNITLTNLSNRIPQGTSSFTTLGSPVQNPFATTRSAGQVQSYSPSAMIGNVRQIKQGLLTLPALYTTGLARTFCDTGLSVDILPSSNTSKFLVSATFYVSASSQGSCGYFNLVRGTTNIFLGNTSGNSLPCTAYFNGITGSQMYCISIGYLDSPNSTSLQTYKIQWTNNNGSFMCINKIAADSNASENPRTPASIIVQEIVG